MGHVSHMNESCHACESYECVMSHIWMSHATHMDESCHTYEWDMSNSRANACRRYCSTRAHTHIKEWCHTYKNFTSHLNISHATCMNGSCHAYEWVMPHVRMSHIMCINELCHTYEWVTPHIWMSHVASTSYRQQLLLLRRCTHTHACTRSHKHTQVEAQIHRDTQM